MASNTERLLLLKKNPATDGNDTFNIESMLNENWEKIDAKVAMVDENGKVINKDGSPAGGVTTEEFVAHQADYLKHTGYAVSTGSANAYIANLNPALSVYAEGVSLRLKINIENTGASTVNVNGLGAKAIKKSNGNDIASGNLKLGSVYTLAYDGASFILQGEGGEYGTAIAGDVLTGKTIGTENGIVAGTLNPGKQRVTGTITSAASTALFPDQTGANTTSAYVPFNFANLPFIPSVIYFTRTNKAALGYPTIYFKDDFFYSSATNHANVSTGSATAFRVVYVNGVVNIPVNGQSISFTWTAEEE